MQRNDPRVEIILDKDDEDALVSEMVRQQMKEDQLARTKGAVTSEEHDDVMALIGMPGYEKKPAAKSFAPPKNPGIGGMWKGGRKTKQDSTPDTSGKLTMGNKTN